MSYDFEIRKDQHYSEVIDIGSITTYLASLPSMQLNGDVGYLYQDGAHYAEIWLEHIRADGDIETGLIETINCIRVTIPYAYMDATKVDTKRYFQLCRRIASHLGWKAYDQQKEQYLSEEPVSS